MNEQTLISAMQTAVADEPASRVDPDRLADTAVRRRTQRRAVLLSTSAVVVATAAAVGLSSPWGSGAAPPVAPGASSTAQTPPADPHAHLTQRGKEMTEYLRQRLPEVVPGATDIQIEEWDVLEVPRDADYISSGANTTVRFTAGDRTYQVHVRVATPWNLPEHAGDICTEIEDGGVLDRCDIRELGDGSKLAVITTKDGRLLKVEHERTDGVVVRLSSAGEKGYSVLGEQQQTELATDPRLGI